MKTQSIRKAVLGLCSATVALAVCEAVLWAVGYNYSPLHISVRGQLNDRRQYHALQDAEFRCDPDLFWCPRENCDPFNSQGFRGGELSEEKLPGQYRIFALGDSNTLGWRSYDPDQGANWPQFLEMLLQSSNKKITVTNAGAYGYSSFQGRKRFQKILPYEPDMVLVSFGGNDAHRVPVPDVDYVCLAPGLLLKSRVGQLGWSAWEQTVLRPSVCLDKDLVARVSLEQYRQNLTEIVRVSRRQGVRCILLTRPFIGESEDPLCWKTHAPKYVAATLEVGRAEGVPVIDLHEAFKTRPKDFADESHFTEAGHWFAAEIIHERIQRFLPQ